MVRQEQDAEQLNMSSPLERALFESRFRRLRPGINSYEASKHHARSPTSAMPGTAPTSPSRYYCWGSYQILQILETHNKSDRNSKVDVRTAHMRCLVE